MDDRLKTAILILKGLLEGAYLTDSGGRIVFWNRSAVAITGFEPSEVTGVRCGEGILMHIDSGGTSMCSSDCPVRSSAGGRECERFGYIRHKKGYRVPVRLRGFPLITSAGEVYGTVQVFTEASSGDGGEIEELRDQAFRDPLTGLYNRRFLEENLSLRISEAGRYSSSAGVIFLDLDGFKSVNDTWGHAAGDRLLQAVSGTLEKNLRTSDVAGRWGGDEFMVIIPGADLSSLEKTSEKLRNLIKNTSVPCPGGRAGVSVSAGVSVIEKSDTPERLLERVDRLLYTGKKRRG